MVINQKNSQEIGNEYIDGLSVKEISEKRGITPAQVKAVLISLGIQLICEYCGKPVGINRSAIYCKQSHEQAAYKIRKKTKSY